MRTNPQPAAAPVSHHYPDRLSRESWVCSPRNGFRRHAWKCHLGVFPKRFVLTAAGREEATRLELALRCSRSPGKEARGAGERGGPWDKWAAASSRSGPDTGLQKLWTFTLLSRGSPSLGGGSQVGYTALRGKERRQVPSHLKGAQGSAHHHWVSPWALTCHRLALLPASLTPTRGPPIGRSFPGRRSGAKRHQPRRGAREDEPGLPQPKGSATPTHSPSSSSGTPGRIWSGTWSSGWRST